MICMLEYIFFADDDDAAAAEDDDVDDDLECDCDCDYDYDYDYDDDDAHDAYDDDDAPTFLRALPSHPALAARRAPRRPASRAPRREVLFGRPGVAPGACPRGRCVAAEGRGGRKRNRIM